MPDKQQAGANRLSDKTDDMAEKSWQVMHMNVMKGITTAQSNEHQRNWTESGWKHAIDKGTYDRQRERLNFEIVKGGKVRPINKDKSIPERMAENLAGRGIKDPNSDLAEPKFRTVVDFYTGRIEVSNAAACFWRPGCCVWFR